MFVFRLTTRVQPHRRAAGVAHPRRAATIAGGSKYLAIYLTNSSNYCKKRKKHV